MLNSALGREAVASVPPDRASVGSGATNTSRYTAPAIGVTVVALIALIAPVDRPAGVGGLVSGWNTAALVTAAISLTGDVIIVALRPAQSTRRR